MEDFLPGCCLKSKCSHYNVAYFKSILKPNHTQTVTCRTALFNLKTIQQIVMSLRPASPPSSSSRHLSPETHPEKVTASFSSSQVSRRSSPFLAASHARAPPASSILDFETASRAGGGPFRHLGARNYGLSGPGMGKALCAVAALLRRRFY